MEKKKVNSKAKKEKEKELEEELEEDEELETDEYEEEEEDDDGDNNKFKKVSISIIWKNFSQKTKKNYWVFVTDNNDRMACFNPDVLKKLGLSLEDKMIKFEFPQTMLLKIKEANGSKTIQDAKSGQLIQEPIRKNYQEKGSQYAPPKKNDDEILRMNVLRTAVEFLAGKKSSNLKELQKLTNLFAEYVKTGEWK